MNKNNKGVDPDDVDSLIEEWQTSFGNEKKEPTTKEKLKTTAPTPKKEPLKASTITQSKPQKNEIDNEIDDLLSDISVTNDISTPTLSTVKSTTTKTIVTPTPTTATQKTAPSSSVTPSPSSSSAKKRCDPLCIGGSKDIAGVTLSMVSQKKCTNIRCSGCDFKVISFVDYCWDSTVDYLFFRNYIFNEAKLMTKLVRKMGFSAYACQCTWKSVNSLEVLSFKGDMKWRCAGHSVE
eukprot:TRINITY_DN1307_c0_g1_i6.p1 TRINITY_DN1307_c0_g1~~TRINITY_DN1307_c0_g1_i6.p1  ORF type:complete len:256 (-),score=58.25 TRINITY_DN1307_c0_g1_i6:170-877(-)